jgi:pimeloyl-ACP methyl ester carboxylesterase
VNKFRLLLIRTAFQFLSPIFPKYFAKWATQFFLSPTRYARPAWESAILTQNTRHVVRDKYQYFLFGEHGPVVMFVHGWAGRGSQFGNYVQALQDLGFRVVLFDGPAHFGRLHQLTDLKEFSSAMIDCQKEFGELSAIVAHSFGGAATGLALYRGLQSRAAVLLATPASVQRVFDNFSRLLRLHARAKEVLEQTVTARVGMSEIEASLITLAPHMKIPVLVVHDPKDNEVNYKSALEIKALWPTAEIYAPERVGHYRLLKDSAVIQKIVEFIVTKQTEYEQDLIKM